MLMSTSHGGRRLTAGEDGQSMADLGWVGPNILPNADQAPRYYHAFLIITVIFSTAKM